jgi:ATP phosphoribosyltransferase
MKRGSNLRLALQRSGRLAEGSQCLLTKCGVKVLAAKHQLMVQDQEFGIDFIFARDDDIPGMVEKGVCDLGIIGNNLMEEYCGQAGSQGDQLEIVMPLGFAQCKLSLAVPQSETYQEIGDLEGKVIATSYPNIVRQFLANNNVNATIVTMHGSVELAPQMGISDIICDLVSSGATLKENGLKEWMTVTKSEAILIAKKESMDEAKQAKLQRLLLRINGIIKADCNKYVMLHIEREKLPLLAQILPGSESPTVVELQQGSSRVAVHVVSHENIFWDTIEKLKAIGAGSILVLPIEKMIS